MTSRERRRPRAARWIGQRATPGARSIRHGMPKPTAVDRPSGGLAASSTASTSASSTPASRRARAGRSRWCTRGPRRPRPARSFVPPRSTPITQSPAIAAPPYTARMPERRRHGPRRPSTRTYRARPRLLAPRRARRRRAADRAPRRAARRRRRSAAPAPEPDRRRACSSGSSLALVGWILLSRRPVPDQRADRVGQGLRRRRRALAAAASRYEPEHDPRARLRRAREGHAEPGAQTIGAPSRSDSIMLLRIGGGTAARLSIPRDTVVDIPGHGRDKINAAYAFGGAALAIRTVEQYLGIDVNHLIEVNFDELPAAHRRDGRRSTTPAAASSPRSTAASSNGGYTLRLQARRRTTSTASRRSRSRAPARTLQPGARTTSPAPAASRRSSSAMKGRRVLARRLRPPALDLLERAEARAVRHGRPAAARPRARAGVHGNAPTRVLKPERPRRCPTAARAWTSRTPRSRPRSSASCVGGRRRLVLLRGGRRRADDFLSPDDLLALRRGRGRGRGRRLGARRGRRRLRRLGRAVLAERSSSRLRRLVP